MMPWLIELLSFFIKSFIYRKALSKARQKGLLFYLKTLQVVRKSIVLFLLAFALFQIMIFGLIGFIVAIIFLYPEEIQWKLWALLIVSGVLFFVPMTFLFIIFSERVWYKASGAENMMSQDNY